MDGSTKVDEHTRHIIILLNSCDNKLQSRSHELDVRSTLEERNERQGGVSQTDAGRCYRYKPTQITHFVIPDSHGSGVFSLQHTGQAPCKGALMPRNVLDLGLDYVSNRICSSMP